MERYASVNAATALLDTKGAPLGLDAPIGATIASEDVTGFFFLEVFAGTGRLSGKLEKDLAAVGRNDVKIIRAERDDILEDDFVMHERFG